MEKTVIENLRVLEAFSSLKEVQLAEIAQLCKIIHIAHREQIIESGEKWRGLYIIQEGSVIFSNSKESNDSFTVDLLKKGDHFGDDGLFSDADAFYTIFGAVDNTILIHLPKENFKALLEKQPAIDRVVTLYKMKRTIEMFLVQSSVFAFVPIHKLAKLVKSLDSRKIKENEYLIHQGEEAHEAYFIHEGVFRVFTNEAPNATVALLERGQLLGEIGLIRNEKRAANIIAQTPGHVFVIPRQDFLSLFTQEEDLTALVNELVQKRLEILRPGEKRVDKKAKKHFLKNSIKFLFKVVSEKIKGEIKFRTVKFPEMKKITEDQSASACIAFISNFYDLPATTEEIKDLLDLHDEQISIYDLKRAAKKLGFISRQIVSSYNSLMKSNLPAIVRWKDQTWVVVCQMNARKVKIANPKIGVIDLSKKEFMDNWTHYTLLIKPTEYFFMDEILKEVDK